MSRIFITGDTHGTVHVEKVFPHRWKEGIRLKKDDILIVCGDFAAVWDGGYQDSVIQSLWAQMPYTVCFVDGNHENHELLCEYPITEWNGGRVHRIGANIIHWMRGEVYTINGKTFFAMGGADSIDKNIRRYHIDWWENEIPSHGEMLNGIASLQERNGKVDYIVSHDGPRAIVNEIIWDAGLEFSVNKYALNEYFDKIAKTTEFKRWYFGHHHMDITRGKFTCCFDQIHEIV